MSDREAIFTDAKDRLAAQRDDWRAEVSQLRMELADAQSEGDAALATIGRVKALHRPAPTLDQCLYDGLIWPCRTIRVIDSPTASEADNG